jgi:hypothetical protein
MTTMRRTNAEWQATLARAAHEEWKKLRGLEAQTEVESERSERRPPDFYSKLSYPDKARYHGRGCVYNTFGGKDRIRHPDCWRIEWSSGKRGKSTPSGRPSAKILYHSLTVWGTYAEARALLDLIVATPYCPLEEAKEIIEPYVRWRGSTRSGLGAKKRVIIGPIPVFPSATPEDLRRYGIQLDYWRMRLLDTIEAYRRFDDD